MTGFYLLGSPRLPIHLLGVWQKDGAAGYAVRRSSGCTSSSSTETSFETRSRLFVQRVGNNRNQEIRRPVRGERPRYEALTDHDVVGDREELFDLPEHEIASSAVEAVSQMSWHLSVS
jgi:hypothetical protein